MWMSITSQKTKHFNVIHVRSTWRQRPATRRACRLWALNLKWS